MFWMRNKENSFPSEGLSIIINGHIDDIKYVFDLYQCQMKKMLIIADILSLNLTLPLLYIHSLHIKI